MTKSYTFFLPALLFLSLLFQNHSSVGQPGFLWARPTGGTLADAGSSVAVDTGGNVYTTGYFQGLVDFNPSADTFYLASSGIDIFVTKTDAAGNFVWAKKMGGTAADYGTSIAVDIHGDVYISGYFSNSADFDPGTSTFYLSAAGNTDIFICKLSTTGNFVWAKQMGGSGFDYGNSITLDAAGNIYTAGYFRSTGDFDPSPGGVYNMTSAGGYDAFVCKINAMGDYVWARQLGGTGGDFGSSVAVDLSGNVCVTGWFEGTSDFDPGSGVHNMTSAGLYDIFVSKLDASGNYVWAKQMGGTTNDEGNSIGVDATGNIYTTGWFGATADFDPSATAFSMVSAGGTDIFVSKLDASGNFAWAKRMGGTTDESGTSLFVDGNASVYTTGGFTGSGDFNPGAGFFPLTSLGQNDIFISKLDFSGNYLWAVSMGGFGTDNGYDVAVDEDGFLYTTGKFQNTVDFDPRTGIYDLTSNGVEDIFIEKFCQSGPDAPADIFGNDTICQGHLETYWIDPVPDAMSYSWILPNGWTGSSTTTTINVIADTTSGFITALANNDCGSNAKAMYVTVRHAPYVHITTVADTVCVISMNIELSALPYGGVYSGNGVTDSLFSPTAAGTGLQRIYYTVTDTNGCDNTDTLEIFVDICVGIDAVSEKSAMVEGYPNPTQSQYHLTTGIAGSSLIKVEIYDIPGQLLYAMHADGGQKHELTVDISSLAPGVYFARVYTESGVRTLRINKE